MPTRRMESFGDWIGNFNFRVEIEGVDAGHFTAVDGLSAEHEVVEYQDCDDPTTRKRPGRTKFGDVTLKKGYVASTVLHDWFEATRVGNNDYDRRIISIVLCNNGDPLDGASEIKRWNLFECFPKAWKVGGLDGKGNDALTEEIVIAYEWFEEA